MARPNYKALADWVLEEPLEDPDLAALQRKNWRRIVEARPRLGRWVYCKYCRKNTCPDIHTDGSIVVCQDCGYGLAPMDEVCRFGSYAAWHEDIVRRFNEQLPPEWRRKEGQDERPV